MSETKWIAKVAVEKVAYTFDKDYSYSVPDSLLSSAKPGCRVLVFFGSGTKKRCGMIMDIEEVPKEELSGQKLKSISSVLDKSPLLSEELLNLARWIKERTFCTLFDAVKAMLPAGINLKFFTFYSVESDIEPKLIESLSEDERKIYEYLLKRREFVRADLLYKAVKLPSDCTIAEELVRKKILIHNDNAIQRVGDATIRMVRLRLNEDECVENNIKLAPKQKTVVKFLEENGTASVKEIVYYTGVTVAVITTLNKKGVLELFENEYYRMPVSHSELKPQSEKITLTEKQEKAFRNMWEQYLTGKAGVSLLYGVTGSGKTQVFLKLIDEVIRKDNCGVIVMVPEIALTPQTVRIFQSRYGKNVAVFHSALSMGERLDEWKRVKNGEALIAVGTRSAVFAPFDNLGLIIMDEEQEHTYKSDSAPRFHARDVAKYRCAQQNALLVLASATPSLESYSMALAGRYKLSRLDERYGKAVLPEVITVDMCQEQAMGNPNPISSALYREIEHNLEVHQQSILLMNRRGYNTFVSCQSCGHVVTCPHCSISMTYHFANNRLMCHYCGYSVPLIETCSECGKQAVRYAGYGTQKIEESLCELFPNARILRMDTDTTMSRFSHEEKLNSFSRNEFDIMIGTQMVAKGLDFENVTLVGVLSADQQLYNDDYRSLERTFSLITQVVGRAGRGNLRGRAIIQTMTPENPVLLMASEQDYDAFYNSEITLRKALIYPPYCDLFCIGFVGPKELNVKEASEVFANLIKNASKQHPKEKIILLGPMASKISKVSNKYRYRLIIKCHNTTSFRSMVSEVMNEFSSISEFRNVTVFVDINPESIF